MHLYIHIPFCKQKCSYCDFVSGSYPAKTQDDYISSLILELDRIFLQISPDRFKTIYIGGGTPSALSRYNIERLLQTLSCINLDHLEEFTMECNPESVDEKLVVLMKKYKIRRVSMGVQSANEDELRFLDRIHDFDQVKKAVALLRSYDIQNISLDLIFDLPGQNLQSLQNSIDAFVSLKPRHISCYSLIIEPGTPMMQWLKEGKISVGSDENYVLQQRFITEELAKHGFHQYEISNYAQDGSEAIHNSSYWTGKDYIGAGISAHSKEGRYRYANTCDIERYIRCLRSDRTDTHPAAKAITAPEGSPENAVTLSEISWRAPIDQDTIEELSPKDRLNELFFLGLRRNVGISKEQIAEAIKELPAEKQKSAQDRIDRSIKDLLAKKLLQSEGDRIFLTQEGREISNTVFVELML